MAIFGKQLRDYVRFTRTGMILIVLMGVTRFLVGISGVPYERATHLVSMTGLTMLLFIVYGHRTAEKQFGTYRHLLPIASALAVSMYGFIVLAILAEGLGGLQGYFHYHSLHNLAGKLPPQLAGLISIPALMSLPNHIAGQLILGMIPAAFVGWGMASLGFLLSPYIAFVRNAFPLLVGLAVIRVLTGAAGVPPAIGTWLTSLTLLTMILAVYYGYVAPSRGFHKWWQVILIALVISFVFNLIVISGILITTNLGIANYFDAEGVSLGQHIAAHFLGAIVEVIPLSILAGIAFAIAKRKPALKSATIALSLAAALGFGSSIAHAQSWQPPADSQRCPSKWGAGDQRGSGNHMSPETVLRATRLIKTGKVFELGHVLNDSMPLSAGRRDHHTHGLGQALGQGQRALSKKQSGNRNRGC